MPAPALAQDAAVAPEPTTEPAAEDAVDPTEPAAAEPAPAVDANPNAEPELANEPEPAVEPEAVNEPEPVVVTAPVVVVAPAPPDGPSLLPLKLGTSTWSRFEYRENYDKLGVSRARFNEGDTTVFRARLTFQTNDLDLGGIKGSIYFAPQASGTWGTSGTGGTVGEANLGIYEGYFKLSGEHLTFKAGRFAMNYGDSLVIGNLDWHQSGRAFDGVHFSAQAGKASIDAFFTQQASGWPTQAQPFLAGDAFFWGAYGSFGPAIVEGLDLDIYALGKSWGAANTSVDDGSGGTIVTHQDAATFVTLGARAKQKLGVFDYRAEADLQVGKTQATAGDAVNKLAYQGDLELGVTPLDALRISVNGVYATGNKVDTQDTNEAYDELFPTTHKWLGFMDVIGFRTNVFSANLKAAVKLGETVGLNVDGHLFLRPEGGGLGDVGNDVQMAGYEVDAGLAKKLGKFGLIRGLYGIFIPATDHYASNSAAHYVEIEAGMRF